LISFKSLQNHQYKYIALGFLVMVLISGSIILLFGNKPKNQTAKDTTAATRLAANNLDHNQLVPLPKAPLTCNANVSLVSLTSYYVVSDLGCYSASDSSVSPAPLNCNGNMFHDSVNLNCYRPYTYTFSSALICHGQINPINSTTVLTLNYNCTGQNFNSPVLYSCSGSINYDGYQSVSVPMSVNCSA